MDWGAVAAISAAAAVVGAAAGSFISQWLRMREAKEQKEEKAWGRLNQEREVLEDMIAKTTDPSRKAELSAQLERVNKEIVETVELRGQFPRRG